MHIYVYVCIHIAYFLHAVRGDLHAADELYRRTLPYPFPLPPHFLVEEEERETCIYPYVRN